MMQFSGVLLEALKADSECVLWRGRSGDGVSQLLVLPRSETSPPSALRRLENEYALREELQSAWAIRPLALTWFQKRPALLLEDPGGEPLSRMIGHPLRHETFLRVALTIANAVAAMHRQGLVHNALEPDNILIDGSYTEARITGFGCAWRDSEAHSIAQEAACGALTYLAPEQTGRMNQAVDARSDLYALGVILYEMLTGSPPFEADDAMALIHAHLAQHPTQPARSLPDLPPALSSIVMRLLAKPKEDRYQTAATLAEDLRGCLLEWNQTGAIRTFPPSIRDVPEVPAAPGKLYGRDNPLGALKAALQRVRGGGQPELVLISGFSGVGKTSLVQALRETTPPRHILFAACKFDRHKQDIPYGTLAQSFQSLIRQLLVKPEPELEAWRDALRQAMGANARLLVDLAPELTSLIGPQPPPPELSSPNAEDRCHSVLNAFLGVFATQQHPLVLFLDDLQWLDAATMRFLPQLVAPSNRMYLLVIGAFRTEEVDPSHPLGRMCDAVRASGTPMESIPLAPLSSDDLQLMIAEMLHSEPEQTQPLARLVHQKTAGNPFFAVQFLRVLGKRGLLSFDAARSAWEWDLEAIRAQAFTENVVELMIDKLKRLPIPTRETLELLACVGDNATIDTLARLRGGSPWSVRADLWEAEQEGLVVCQNDHCHFLHDRVQEAAYSVIPESRRPLEHLRIGRLLLSALPPEALEEHAFEIVNQLDRGAAHIHSEPERERLAELHLLAARRAKAAAAYAAALEYSRTGASLLGPCPWDPDRRDPDSGKARYALAFALELLSAQCEYLTGDLESARERLTMLASRATNTVDLAEVTCASMALHITMVRVDLGAAALLGYLERVGIRWPLHPTEEQVREEYARLWHTLGDRPIESLIDLPPMSDPECRATLSVLTSGNAVAFLTDERLYCLVNARMANLSLQQGNSPASSHGYAVLGMILGSHFGDVLAGFRFGKLGVDLAEKHCVPRFQTRVYQVFGHWISPWVTHMRNGLRFVRRAQELAEQAGDLTAVCHGSVNLINLSLAVGNSLAEIQTEAERALAFARKVKFEGVADFLAIDLRLIRTFRGLDPEFDEARFEAHLEHDPHFTMASMWYWVRKLQMRLQAGEYRTALEAAARAEQVLATSPARIDRGEFHFYAALAHAGQCGVVEDRGPHLTALAAHREQLLIWARHCAANFANRALLVAAEIARLEGRDFEALSLYEDAIRSAHDNGFIQNAALAHELAGRFHLQRGLDTGGHAHLRAAHACYSQWGAEGLAHRLEQQYPSLTSLSHPSSLPPRSVVRQVDVATVVKAAESLSGQSLQPKLVESLMTLALQNAGADRGLLILRRGDEERIEAEAQAQAGRIEVDPGIRPTDSTLVPRMIVRYVLRTGQTVILDDTAAPNLYSDDEYFHARSPRSVLCVPLMRQGRLTGLLYLENTLTSHAFSPERIGVLELLTGQAAIALDNAQLYADLRRENQERRQAEATLREREARIRRLIESNIIGIIFWTADGRITAANDALLRLVGYSRDELTSGKIRWTALTPPEYGAIDARALEQLRRRGICTPFEKEYLHKDGHRVPVLIGAANFEDSLEEGVAFVLDLTERKQAEMDRQARQLAEAASRAKTEFLAHMSHELRTPLNGILGYTQLLLHDTHLGERQRDRLGIIQRSGEHLLALINDVLDLARIESGRLELSPAELALPEFLQLIRELTLAEARQKGLKFICDTAPDLPGRVWIDRMRLRQVLLNLLDNAVKFTDAGEVRLTIGLSAPARLRFAVEDTGIGIAPEQWERIFRPFEQLGDWTSRAGGTGLGLAICRQLVQLMGGTLRLNSRLGKGSTFWFELDVPVIDPAWVAASAPPSLPTDHPRKEDPGPPPLPPPVGWLEQLHRLAEEGDMRAITQQAHAIGALDARYQPFANRLHMLARTYQSQAILRLVQECLQSRP